MQKEADEKIKEGTLDVDGGTDAMTVVFGKEKGGYARGVGSGVTYIRGILIFLEAEKKLMKDLSYFKLNLIMRDASVKKKIYWSSNCPTRCQKKMSRSRNCPVRWQKHRECLLT